MACRKLVVNVSELNICRTQLEDAIENLESIQRELQKAIDALKTQGGWQSNSSKEFMKNYKTTWIAGVSDRKAIMQRMCDNIGSAIKEYEAVEDAARKLIIS